MLTPLCRAIATIATIASPFGLSAQSWSAGPPVPTAGNAPRAGATALHASVDFLLVGGTPLDANGDAPVHALVNGTSWQTRHVLPGGFQFRGVAEDELERVVVIAGVDAIGDVGDTFHWTHEDGDAGGLEERSGQAPKQRFAVAVDDLGRIYSCGGSANGAATTAATSGRVERYDANLDQWSVLAPMPTPVADASACYDGAGYIVVVGGYDTSGNRIANVARYDIAADTWSDTAIDDLPAPRSGLGVVLGANNHIYAIGGSAPDGSEQATTFLLDQVTGTWSLGPTLLHAREHFGCAIDESDNVWAIGGETTNTTEYLLTPACPELRVPLTDAHGYQGSSVGWSVALDGAPPFTFVWRADGVPLSDGPTGNGSTIVGATTANLAIVSVTAADAVPIYDCVITNACGATTTNGVHVGLIDPAILPTAFAARSIHPAGASASAAHSVDGTTIVGSRSYTHTQYGTQPHAIVWDGFDGLVPPRTLTPANSVGSVASKVRGDAIVGWWWWPYTTPLGTGYHRNASVWTGNGAVHHQAQTSGWEFGSLADTDGIHHVGSQTFEETSTNSDGHYWPATGRGATRLTPITAWGSGCNAIDGNFEYGQVHIGFGIVHAAKWEGASSAWIDMNPSGSSRSHISGAGDGLQCGTAYFGGVATPGIWSGSPASFVPLTPAGAQSASLSECRYGLIVGSVVNAGSSSFHAAVWRASAQDWMDLHVFVPPEFTSSTANDVYRDPLTGEITIVGSGYNTSTGRTEALVWRPAELAAQSRSVGTTCPVTLRFSPDGNGGYDVSRTAPIWFDDSLVGIEVAAGGLLPEDTLTAPLTLGFAFPMPGGVPTSQILVDDNGRIVRPDALAASLASPSIAQLLQWPSSITPLWTDLSSARGSVRFYTDPTAGFATVTWRDVPQRDRDNAFTFQVRLDLDGSFSFNYRETRGWANHPATAHFDAIVGCSAGRGAVDPGPSDYATYPIASAGLPTVYQHWQSALVGAPSLQTRLRATSLPILGASWNLQVENLTSGTQSSHLLLGFSNPNLDLTGILGLDGCGLWVNPAFGAISLTPVMLGDVRAATFSLAIPNIPALAGVLRLYAQGAILAAGETALGVVLTDGLEGIVGY